MEKSKEEILNSLREVGCIDDDIYNIIKSLYPLEENIMITPETDKKLYSLVSPGFKKDQLHRLRATQLLLAIHPSPILGSNYPKEFDDIYQSVKEWYSFFSNILT